MANVKHEVMNESAGDLNKSLSGGRPGGPGNQSFNAGSGFRNRPRGGGPGRNDGRNFNNKSQSGGNQGSRGGNESRGGGGGGRGRSGPSGERFAEDRIMDKLHAISGPTIELPPLPEKEKKFGGNCRLYVGNAGPNFTEQDLAELFKPYGETSEPFYSLEKNFGFIKMDERSNAERAKKELDGQMRKGKPLKVRFAPPGTTLKIKNLSDQVSNELLELAFSVFGEVDRAVVIADERGNSTGEGIVEFSRKPGATACIRKCQEGCFFLTSDLRPVIVEPYEPIDDSDGLPDKNLNRRNPAFVKARESGPRFAKPGSFEFEYGARWKSLYELFQQKVETLKREMKIEEEKLAAQMEYARYEHETEILREQLRQREEDRERQKMGWEMKQRQAEELRRQGDEMSLRMMSQEEELRRRQLENPVFQQQDQKPFIDAYEGRGFPPAGGNRFEGNSVRNESPSRGGGRPEGRWQPAADRRPGGVGGGAGGDDFQNKRRRY